MTNNKENFKNYHNQMEEETINDVSCVEKEIDDKMIGIAIVIGSICAGAIMMFFPEFYGRNTFSSILKWVFILIGVIGLLCEFSSKLKSKSILGIDDVTIGLCLCVPTVVGIKFNLEWWLNCIFLIIAWFGAIMVARGVLKFFASAFDRKIVAKQIKFKDLFTMISMILGTILVMLQIVQGIKTFM